MDEKKVDSKNTGKEVAEETTKNANTEEEIVISTENANADTIENDETTSENSADYDVPAVQLRFEGAEDEPTEEHGNIPMRGTMPTKRKAPFEEAGDSRAERESYRSLRMRAINEVDDGIDWFEAAAKKDKGKSSGAKKVMRDDHSDGVKVVNSAGEKKGMGGSKAAAKKAKGRRSSAGMAATEVGNETDEVKALTSTSVEKEEGEAVVSNEEKKKNGSQSEKNGNGEEGKASGETKEGGSEDHVVVRKSPRGKNLLVEKVAECAGNEACL